MEITISKSVEEKVEINFPYFTKNIAFHYCALNETKFIKVDHSSDSVGIETSKNINGFLILEEETTAEDFKEAYDLALKNIQESSQF